MTANLKSLLKVLLKLELFLHWVSAFNVKVNAAPSVGTVPTLGAAFTFTLNADTAYPSGSASTSFSGWVTKVDEKGGNKEFVKVSVTAVDFEGVSA